MQLLRIVGLAVCLSLSAACDGGEGGGSEGEIPTLEVGTSASITLHSLPAIAVEKGFDEDEGLHLQIRQFATGSEMVEGVAAGELQVAQAGDVPFISLVSGGVPVHLVSQLTESGENYTFWVSEDIDPQSPKDLEGHTFALPFGSTSSLIMSEFIDTYELNRQRIDLVDMQPNDIVTAYSEGEIDGFILWSPASNQAAERRPSVKVHDAYRGYFPSASGSQRLGAAHTVVFARDEFLEEQPEVVQSYLRALNRAAAFLNDPETQDEARQIIADALEIDEEIVAQALDEIGFQLDIGDALVQDLGIVSAQLAEAGQTSQEVDVADFLDTGPLSEVDPDLVEMSLRS